MGAEEEPSKSSLAIRLLLKVVIKTVMLYKVKFFFQIVHIYKKGEDG